MARPTGSSYDNGGNGLTIRVTRVEAATQAIKEQVTNLEGEFHSFVDELRGEFGKLRDDFSTKARPNYAVWISMASLVVSLIGMASFAGWTITNMEFGYMNNKIQTTLDWQKDYQLGRIPSSAEPQIAALKEHNTEIETQFRGSKSEMEMEIAHNTKENDRQDGEVKALRDRMRVVEEKSTEAITRLNDHDKYLWPTVQQNSSTLQRK